MSEKRNYAEIWDSFSNKENDGDKQNSKYRETVKPYLKEARENNNLNEMFMIMAPLYIFMQPKGALDRYERHIKSRP